IAIKKASSSQNAADAARKSVARRMRIHGAHEFAIFCPFRIPASCVGFSDTPMICETAAAPLRPASNLSFCDFVTFPAIHEQKCNTLSCMKSAAEIQATTRTRLGVAVFCGGAIAGILDLAYAIVVYTPRHPILIPQTIASGILGAQSFHDGAASAALGVALHFLIAFVAAATFVLVCRRLTFLVRRPFFWGAVYGAIVYAVMHAAVLPLSRAPQSSQAFLMRFWEFLEHCAFVGLPIALAARRWAGFPTESNQL
ncbi:MAG TPA: hypothetical protein VFN62_07650, partial [Acidobacteriaceae bacterium]|nr:hypothetical protein [Acidobacteriaceae bacterium]